MEKRTCSELGCDNEERLVRGLCRKHYSWHKRHGSLPETWDDRSESQRRWDAIDKSDPDACWPWPTAGLTTHGYGIFHTSEGPMGAHRWSYREHNGPLVEGLDVGHVCHDRDPDCEGTESCPHRACVNPAHLVQMSRRENANAPAKARIKITVCPEGHEYTPENTYVYEKTRHRQCLTCMRAKSLAAYYRRRDANIAKKAS